MKRTGIVATVVLGLLSTSGLAFADGEKGGDAPKDKAAEGRWAKRTKARAAFFKKLGVSAETTAKIKELWAEWKKTRDPLRAEARAKRKELRALLQAETIDTAKVDALAGEIAEKRAAIIKGRISHRAKFLALLTPEQRKKLAERRKGMRKHWRKAMQNLRMKTMMHPVGK